MGKFNEKNKNGKFLHIVKLCHKVIIREIRKLTYFKCCLTTMYNLHHSKADFASFPMTYHK